MRVVTFALATLLLAGIATVGATSPTWPPPTMPKFDGYVALAQFRCMDFLCPEWSMGVTRLSTECFTWGCKYEQQHLNELAPTAPVANMGYQVLTAYHRPSRIFYTFGYTEPLRGSGYLWTSTIAANVNSSSVQSKVRVDFPWNSNANPLVSLETHPSSGEPIALFSDGTLGTIESHSGNFTKRGVILSQGSQRQATQVTAVNTKDSRLYVLLTQQNGTAINAGWPTLITVDLRSWATLADVNTPNMSSQLDLPPMYFEMQWVPQVNSLVVFATGNFDSILYMDPTNGNTSLAIWDLATAGNYVTYFSDNYGTKVWDTAKNTAFDEEKGWVYFQAHVETEGEGMTSLMAVGPFTPNSVPQPFYWTYEAISPMNFGYTGMHFVYCDGPCPT